MTESTLNTSSLSITSVIPVTDSRVFTDIHFTCTGIITNWIVGHDGQGTGFPVIKIRQSSNLTTTTALNIDNAVNISHNVYNFTVNNGVIVQPGDILMIECNTTNRMYYQKGNGPFNYRLGENDILTRIDSNDYPLISVIISKYKHCYTIIIIIIIFTEPTTAAASNEMSYTVTDQITTSINLAVSSLNTFTTTSNTIQTAVTSYSISITLSTTIATVTTASGTVTPASITSSTTTTTISTASGTVTPTLQGNTAGSTVPAVISTVLILLLVVSILVIIIVSVLMYKRKKRFTLKMSTGGDGNHDTSTMRKYGCNNPSYQPQGTHTYKYYQHYFCTVKLHEEPINTTITDNPSYGVNKRRNQGRAYVLPVPLNIINDIVYIQVLNQCMMNQGKQVILQ